VRENCAARLSVAAQFRLFRAARRREGFGPGMDNTSAARPVASGPRRPCMYRRRRTSRLNVWKVRERRGFSPGSLRWFEEAIVEGHFPVSPRSAVVPAFVQTAVSTARWDFDDTVADVRIITAGTWFSACFVQIVFAFSRMIPFRRLLTHCAPPSIS
jgi:hypothetical protein